MPDTTPTTPPETPNITTWGLQRTESHLERSRTVIAMADTRAYRTLPADFQAVRLEAHPGAGRPERRLEPRRTAEPLRTELADRIDEDPERWDGMA